MTTNSAKIYSIGAAETADLGRALGWYAVETAADMGEDVVAAVRAMRDEPGEVATGLGCLSAEVVAWCDAETASPTPGLYDPPRSVALTREGASYAALDSGTGVAAQGDTVPDSLRRLADTIEGQAALDAGAAE